MAPTFEFTFLRHGESTGNADEQFQGQGEFPLTDEGRRQAQALAERWVAEGKSFDLAISSPLARARETAEIIAHALKIPLETDPLWLERDTGNLTGKRIQDNPPPDFISMYPRFGDTGEGDWALYLRAGHAVSSLLERPPGPYLVVSHGGLLNKVLLAILGIPAQHNFLAPTFYFANTAFATLTYDPDSGRWRVHGINDHSHLEAITTDE